VDTENVGVSEVALMMKKRKTRESARKKQGAEGKVMKIRVGDYRQVCRKT
jgi:hypothetical protein